MKTTAKWTTMGNKNIHRSCMCHHFIEHCSQSWRYPTKMMTATTGPHFIGMASLALRSIADIDNEPCWVASMKDYDQCDDATPVQWLRSQQKKTKKYEKWWLSEMWAGKIERLRNNGITNVVIWRPWRDERKVMVEWKYYRKFLRNISSSKWRWNIWLVRFMGQYYIVFPAMRPISATFWLVVVV